MTNSINQAKMVGMSDPDMNVPMALASAGLSGARLAVSPQEAAQRRGAMAALLANGVSNEDIEQAMHGRFGMAPADVVALREQVAQRMLAESESRRPFKKALAEARLHKHIAAASKRQAWGSVAQLEGQLARIQGTEEPVEQRVTIDARLRAATMTVLSGLTPEQADELVATEIARLPKSV